MSVKSDGHPGETRDTGARQANIEVTPALDGERLDKALAQLVPDLSRTRARKVISMGGVQIAGRRCRVASRPVRAGDPISAAWREDLKTAPEHPLQIVFEDGDLAVLNKPAGQHTQGTALGDVGTLVYSVQRRFGPEARVVHRLDAPASGVIVVGLNPAAVAKLSDGLREHRIVRLYLAATSGHPPEGPCLAPVRRDGRRTEVVPPEVGGAQEAHTDFKWLAERAQGTLVEARLHTGRTHQVRTHLAHLGAPIIGDRLYGGERAPRLCLHAWRLELAHPITGIPIALRQDPDPGFWEAACWDPPPALP